MKLTQVQLTVIDLLSRKVNEYLDEKTQPLLKAMAEGTKKLYETSPQLMKQAKEAGVTPDDLAGREADMPFFEGHSGLRSFFGQALRPQIEEQLRFYKLVAARDALAPGWFENGKFNKLSPSTKTLVRQLAVATYRHPSRPMNIYREQSAILNIKVGQKLNFHKPHSWSVGEKAVMGETTIVASTRYGTNVSVLSKYIGEGEVISYNPKGYVVGKVENHTFGGKRTRRVVFVGDL